MDAIKGIVVEGKKLSRQLGFPTLNLEIEDGFSLKYGVYAGTVEYAGEIYQGAINIGVTPHFGVNKPKLEMHIFNFNGNLYGETVKVMPIHFIREEKVFKNIDKLTEQMARDCKMARDLLLI